ncbi:hypothetical protein HZB03_05055 [Candidatus Woesearchaeota archaeon]|nr:hypothetical protein [Candidatus Woesearchaeota archaeon]
MGSLLTKSLRILNSRERRQIVDLIEKQWGCRWKSDLGLLQSEKDKIYAMSRDVERLDLGKLRVDIAGLYIAQLPNKNEIRLTIEGAQIIGPSASRNVIEVDSAAMRRWLRGEDIEVDCKDCSGFVILRCGNDFLGSGKYKDGIILNFVPKTRRISSDA